MLKKRILLVLGLSSFLSISSFAEEKEPEKKWLLNFFFPVSFSPTYTIWPNSSVLGGGGLPDTSSGSVRLTNRSYFNYGISAGTGYVVADFLELSGSVGYGNFTANADVSTTSALGTRSDNYSYFVFAVAPTFTFGAEKRGNMFWIAPVWAINLNTTSTTYSNAALVAGNSKSDSSYVTYGVDVGKRFELYSWLSWNPYVRIYTETGQSPIRPGLDWAINPIGITALIR